MRRIEAAVTLGGALVMLALSYTAQGQGRAKQAESGGGRQFQTPGDVGQYQWTVMLGIGPGFETTPRTSSPTGAKVSVTELQIPAAALKELQKFQDKFTAGKLEDAAKHAQKAIAIYPRLAGAHHNLGLCYAKMNQYDKAAAEFQNAADLDAQLVPPRLGLAEVSLLLGKYAEGEAAARSALDLDPANTLARYFLARNLVRAGHETAEAVDLLRRSRDEFPGARLSLVTIYLKRNETEDAVKELREYLAQPNVPEKERLACVFEQLTHPNGYPTCTAK